MLTAACASGAAVQGNEPAPVAPMLPAVTCMSCRCIGRVRRGASSSPTLAGRQERRQCLRRRPVCLALPEVQLAQRDGVRQVRGDLRQALLR